MCALLAWPASAAADHPTSGTATYGAGAGLGLEGEISADLGILAPPSPTALGGESEAAAQSQGAQLGAVDDTTGDFHSANFRKLGRSPIEIGDGELAQGSDLAFRGNLMIAGAYEGVGLFRTGAVPRQLSFYDCPGSQGDVSVLGNTMFVSVDSRSSNTEQSATCNNTPTNVSPSSLEKEGVRIVDISDVTNPRQIGFVETECGSHTHTLIPGPTISHIYVDSYPLGPDTECTEANHPEGEFSVIGFPTDNPKKARVASVPDILPPSVTPDTVGCHDTGVMPDKNLAVASCLGAFAVLDITNRVHPRDLGLRAEPGDRA